MPSAKALLGAALGRFLFREATVTRITPLGARFRLVDLEGAALREVKWTPGDKVQVFLDGVGFRTYTPMTWDAVAGTTRFLVYVHDAAYPGAGWGRALAGAGDQAREDEGVLERREVRARLIGGGRATARSRLGALSQAFGVC